jgi:polar amino acid transport system permease protein
MIPNATDLPVLKPFRLGAQTYRFPSPHSRSEWWGGVRGGGCLCSAQAKRANKENPTISLDRGELDKRKGPPPLTPSRRAYARGEGNGETCACHSGPVPTALPFTITHAVVVLAALLLAVGIGQAAAAPAAPSILATLIKWTPLLAQGFALNIAMSFLAMGIGTALGFALGLGLISLHRPVRGVAWFLTEFFRNAPWLVLLFYCMLLLPFELRIGDTIIPLPGWMKSTLGLSLAVMANVAELVRGAVNSIPFGQWEASEALAFTRMQTLRMVILPQCIKRMTPPWMNLYAILTVGTPLTSVVGVSEAMTLTGDILAAENRSELLVPMYLYLLLWFFVYCYPIARFTVSLERRFQVR